MGVWRFIVSVLGIVVATLAIMAAIPKEAAMSNFATYMPDWLLDAAPFLRPEAFDKIVLGIALALAGLLLLFWSLSRHRKSLSPGADMEDKDKPKEPLTIRSSGGGVGAEIFAGSVGPGSIVGMETGPVKVIQTGPGIGLKVTAVAGPGGGNVVGIRSSIIAGKPDDK